MRVTLKLAKEFIVPFFLVAALCLPVAAMAGQSSDFSKDFAAMQGIFNKAIELAPKQIKVDDEEYVLPAPIAEDKLDLGKKVFFKRCVWCHGVKGEGDGPSAKLLITNPRNFLQGTFKIRQTDSGELPFEADLIKTVTTGLPGSAMPAWGGVLSEEEIAAVVQFVKTLVTDRDFTDDEEEINQQEFGGNFEENPWGLKGPYFVGAPDEDVKKGHAIFFKNKCFECHGGLGRGDGNPTMKDDWGFAIVAANWQQCWNFRGSRRNPYNPFNIVRTVSTGLNGTPMPNFKDAIEVRDRWNIAAFVNSLCPRREIDPLTQKPKTDPYVAAVYTKGKISHDMNDPMWQGSYDDKRNAEINKRTSDYTNFPFKPKGDLHRAYIAASGQLAVGKRNFPSHIDNFWVAARWSEDEKAAYVMVEYHNRFLGTGSGEALAIELAANAGGPRPGLIMGDAANAVNIVKATLKAEGYDETNDPREEGYPVSASVENLLGNGFSSVKAGATKGEVVASGFNRGKMSVLFKIPLEGTGLAAGKFVPMAF
ncbi:MAG: c-type cytochrome, partial [Nitrospinales bacterium]